MYSGTSILQSIIQAVNPKDRACFVHNTGLWKTENVLVGTSGGLKLVTRMLFVGYSTGLPVNLGAFVRSFEPASKDFNASIIGMDFYEIKDLLAYIRIFSKDEGQLSGFLRSYQLGTPLSLHSIVKMWKVADNRNLYADIFAIEPKNLIAALRAQWEGEEQLHGVIRGWWSNELEPPDYLGGNLEVFIQSYTEAFLTAELKIVQPRDLLSYIKAWPYDSLISKIRGWATVNLAAWIAIKGQADILSNIGGHYPVDLRSIVKAFHVGNYNDIYSNIITQHIFNINSSINCFNVDYIKLNAIINSRPIHLLNVSIIGWAHRDLYATINAIIPACYLGATIIVSGGYKNLITCILGLLGTQQSSYLNVVISGWQHANLLSSIFSVEYNSLIADINAIGGAKDLKADIKVREIIFSEFYEFSTINTSDLRAYIGFSLCTLRTPRSAYNSLIATILPIPTYDLNVTIKGIKTIFSGMGNLGISINYTNNYSMLSKFLSFKMSTTITDCIKPNPAFFKDSLNITFKIINGQRSLKSLITTQPHNKSLGASIYSRLLIIHGRGNEKVLTEKMVEIDNYKESWSAYIDVYLNTKKPIYYAGGKVFAEDYNEPIISFLFKRSSSLGIKHEYNLKHDLYFDSTDAAIKYGLIRTSGKIAASGLTAKINSVVKNLKLKATIHGVKKELLYTDFPFIYLKLGSLSVMGTCINYMMYKSKSNIFGGVQDMTSSISAISG